MDGGQATQVRAACRGDAEGIARVHTRSWQAAYRGLVPDDYLDGLDWRERLASWDQWLAVAGEESAIVVAADGEDIVGFAAAGPSRDDDLRASSTIEVYALYLAPEAWARGLGAALLAEVVRASARDSVGDVEVAVWVLEGNVRGRRFYERQGFAPDGARQQVAFDGRDLLELRYRARDRLAAQ